MNSMADTDRVNLTPIQRASEKSVQYHLKQVIGRGSYGVVYKAINKHTDQVVAIKEVVYENDEELNDIMAEISLLKNLNHNNIVKYHGFIRKSYELYILLEYCANGSLRRLISRSSTGLSENESKTYVTQTLLGLKYLHGEGVIHRDIKAANILLSADNTVKLADFGVSTIVNSSALTLAGTLNWMAPEILGNRGASTLSDIWSLGATVVEMLTKNPPYHNLTDANIYYAVENDTYYPPSSFSEPLKDFLSKCFVKNMYKRPTADQLLKHVWINSTENVKVDKLNKFKEDFTDADYHWDADFQEEKLNISPSKFSLAAAPAAWAENNQELDLMPPTESQLLSQLKSSSKPLTDLHVLFSVCSLENIADTIIECLSRTTVDKRLITAFGSIFVYDTQHNHSRLRLKFIAMGGIPLIIKFEHLAKEFVIDYPQTLIECGIMYPPNFASLKTPKYILELVYRFYDLTSTAFWCRWCFKHLDISLLLNNIHERRAQSILLKLSSYAPWSFEKILPSLIDSKLKKKILISPQITYVVFKSINYMITTNDDKIHKSAIPSSSSLPLSSSPTRNSPVNSVQSPSRSPVHSLMATRPSSPMRHKSISNFPHLTIPSKSRLLIELPEGFFTWLTSFFVDMAQIKDLSVLKYFTKLCYLTVHINSTFLNDLLDNDAFFAFIRNIDTIIPFIDDAKTAAFIWKQITAICVEMSLDMDQMSASLFSTAMNFIRKKNNTSISGLEIILNCLHFTLRNVNDDVAPTVGSSESHSVFLIKVNNDAAIELPIDQLVDLFYALNDDDVNLSKLISIFTKICSLPGFENLTINIIFHPNFYEKIVSFFDTYFNSLLIQIDLLKFIKLIFTKSLLKLYDYTGQPDPIKQTEPNRRNKATVFKLRAILVQITEFLNNNWNKDDPKRNSNQVGGDSVLICQLCEDIRSLSKKGSLQKVSSVTAAIGSSPTKDERSNLRSSKDKSDGFSVPITTFQT
ncbi:Cdc15p [Saccharomyces cerevisiae YJM1444]|nr:Cdc15p [Saccharomyces cerevisiae YJM1444]CAI4234386.1 AMP_1a_G0000260.mRNA.1.CDS.1 [Saccharomyces cerevisiae]CAI5229436.1 ALI_HP2_G0000720.mRNA.1.CDS.1 [Saccharomyces cerevisiae]CAI6380667.1 ALI_HP2_G0000720.mRNA.1.CDS.1 [Saccharomyces cerevisiae]CAI6383171.1 ALI_HP1_G0000860.mRNA.1.CDS.1 [Saccharomyces cerevisiae]